eukprot:2003310-Pleurochrysis_carterae.AAC.1
MNLVVSAIHLRKFLFIRISKTELWQTAVMRQPRCMAYGVTSGPGCGCCRRGTRLRSPQSHAAACGRITRI